MVANYNAIYNYEVAKKFRDKAYVCKSHFEIMLIKNVHFYSNLKPFANIIVVDLQSDFLPHFGTSKLLGKLREWQQGWVHAKS